MSRLPFLFIITGILGFVAFHTASLLSLTQWLAEELRGPSGWFHIHLFVLGWATMLAMGAIYQLIHVILQRNIYSEKLGYIHYVLFTVGLVGVLYGFHQGAIYWIAISATILMISILVFAYNMAITLYRAKLWNTVTISAACAVIYLVLTAVSGLLMGLNLALGYWIELHGRLYGAHIWLGTIGWFGLLITGFSYKMLPMFYLSHNYPEKLQKVTMILWNAAVIAGALCFLLGGAPRMLQLAIAILTAAIIVYNVHLLQIRKHRHKRNPGAGIQWSMYFNQAFAIIAALALMYSFWQPEKLLTQEVVRLAGWLYLGGWVSLMILSYASKIIPFLWWTHKYGKQAGKRGTPVMSDLLNDRKVQLCLTAIAVSSALMIAGLLSDTKLLISIVGIIFTLCSFFYIALISSVFRR
ncbi:cbb3-type cytochrome c oxidase subunit I [Paenibacillus sp. FSL W7-1287]|uniref:cbb3-type cytochrome c oxidase subunit I n=1 Tax=Paenibacillus sp. FSL W7-1287 TaxID=2954538 RepID=UPI0030F796A6